MKKLNIQIRYFENGIIIDHETIGTLQACVYTYRSAGREIITINGAWGAEPFQDAPSFDDGWYELHEMEMAYAESVQDGEETNGANIHDGHITYDDFDTAWRALTTIVGEYITCRLPNLG